MRRKCIVYTRPDGAVSVCTPSQTAMRFMTNGGGRWDGAEPGFIDRQIEAQAAYGVGERAAERFVMALHKGGCSTSEAYEIMRDRYCAHLGTGCELWDAWTPDKWFRDAWRRSRNGGPITISMRLARKIQLVRIKEAAQAAGASSIDDLWRARIFSARTLETLRRVWPSGISRAV